MGEEDTKHVVERMADVLARLGSDPRGARPTSGASSTDDAPATTAVSSDPSSDSQQTRAVTDGGANGAPPGDVPWAEDDPIVFGDEADVEGGSALLDAVTDSDDETAPPFGDGDADASDQPDSSESATDAEPVDPERLDELEARLDALEGDHVQLETHLADVARGVADIRQELSATGDDVRLLVAALGGIAIARESDGSSPAAGTDLATTLGDIDADELEAALGTLAGRDWDQDGTGEDGGSVAENDDGTAENDDGTAVDDDVPAVDDADSPDDDDDHVTDSAGDDDVRFDGQVPPDGIHRGAGEHPSQAAGTDPDGTDEGDDRPPAEDGSRSSEETAQRVGAESAEWTTGEPAATAPDESAQPIADEPARKLVDPRTEAVGARLRQFREGFVDDPTADLPTGNTADEFRFEKVLLPTDGREAPDLSNAELEKPYLETLPDGYAADAVVLEWLDWLVSAADDEVAAQAVVYYESIHWLTAEVRDDLLGYLEGLGGTTPHPGSATVDGNNAGVNGKYADEDGEADVEGQDAIEPPAALDLQDHLRSLQYVTELASGEVGSDGI